MEMSLEEWSTFFSKSRPYTLRIRQGVMKFHRKKQHKTVINCLKAALIQGQAQPWMYEVLALSMEIEKYPKAEIERVVLSLSDFGAVSFDKMIISAAYLKQYDRKKAALGLYQQASRFAPERHEPYVLSLPLADDIGVLKDIEWAATGILQHYWGKDYKKKHRAAEDAIFNQLRILKRADKQQEMHALATRLKQARRRDLSIRVDWNGVGDLDLEVEEPHGSVCTFEIPLTIAGGIFMHDGSGPDQADCYESYLCPQAVTGPYRVTVKNAFGKVVGNRAVVTIVMHKGLKNEKKIVRTVVLDEGEASFTFDLLDGRRTQPRNLSLLTPDYLLPVAGMTVQRAGNVRKNNSRKVDVLQQFAEDRLQPQRRAGAVGFSPVIQTIPEGTSLTAQAIVSPDRRYVRLSLRPTFTGITDVFTFSFINGNNNNGGQTNNGN